MKKYNIISIISFFVIIIAFLTPAATSSKDGEIFWIWGFRMKNSFTPVNNIPAFNLSIICSLIILICTITAIVITIKYRKGKDDYRGALLGAIIVITTIIWSIAINDLLGTEVETESDSGVVTTEYLYFWDTHYVGFGIIGLIIGGILMVIAGLINYKSEIIKPIIKPDVILRTSFFVKPPVVKSQTDKKKYCLFCGAEVKLGSKSCNECGNEIERLVHFKDKEEKLRETFKIFDCDGSGYVTFDELKRIMKQVGKHLTDQQIISMLKEFDFDDDDKINFEEFIQLMKNQ